jgi:CBS domain-containing protein/uncharacterized protein (DUF2267 family)
MSLEPYRRTRQIVLHPKSTAYEAARAMMENHVGAVLVAEEHTLVGVVTDRDLACEVIANGWDPSATLLADVMSENVVTADIGADIQLVVGLMTEHAIRRVPVIENGRVVGVVALDDLLLEGAIDAPTAVGIIRAQLEGPARYKPEGLTHPGAPPRPEPEPRGTRALSRRSARAAASYARLLEAVERQTGLDAEQSAAALRIVLDLVCRRLLPEDARHFIAQLPSALKDVLAAHLDGPDRNITRESVEQELSATLHMDTARAAETAASVWQAVAQLISAGQIQHTSGQLPREMKELFPPYTAEQRTAATL